MTGKLLSDAEMDAIDPPLLSDEEMETKMLGGSAEIEGRILELGGVKQSDGTYLVPSHGGGAPLHHDAQGNRIGAAPQLSMDAEAGALDKVVATAGSAILPLAPTLTGVASGLQALGQGKDVGDAYRKRRDDTKRTIEQAKTKAGLGYQVLGGVLSGGIAGAETGLARVALGAGLSAAGAAIDSDVDLTSGDADLGQYATEIATSGAIGAVAGGVGEGLGFGLRKAGSAALGLATKAFARQEAADVDIITKVVKSLEGSANAEKGKGWRIIENLRDGMPSAQSLAGLSPRAQADAVALAKSVLANNAADLPGQQAVIDTAKRAFLGAASSATQDAADATNRYFNASLWASEVLPRLKNTIAPRFGIAAFGLLARMGGASAGGASVDKFLGGDGTTGGFVGAVLGAPGMLQMLRNVAKSNRVQKAIGDRLAPLMTKAADSIQRVTVITSAEMAALTTREDKLGPPDLVAQQLVAAGGLASIRGDNGSSDPEVAAFDAPRSELDKAIQTTTGVTLLAGVLEQHHEAVEKGLSRVFASDGAPQKHTKLPALDALGVDLQAMLERLAANTGNLSDVAPGVAAELSATAQRAVDYLAKVGAQPPLAGPLAPKWVPSAAEQRSLRLAQGIVASPMSILDAAAAGMLVPEQVAALNAVCPMLGRSIQDAALARLEAGVKVSYRARLMLGFLTGVDIDGTLASIGPNQQAIRMQSQKPSNAGTPAGGAEKLTVASRASAHQTEAT